MTAGSQQPGWWSASDGQSYTPESPGDPPEPGSGPAPVPELLGPAPSPWWDTPSDQGSDAWGDLRSPLPPPTSVERASNGDGDTLFPPKLAGRASRPTRRGLRVGAGVSLAAVIALVVGLVATVGTPGTPRTSGTSATANSDNIVLTSARSTLAAKTADLHLSMVMQVPGAGQVTGTGDGVVDFGNNSGQMAVQYTGLPQASGAQLTEVYAGANLYVSTPGISQLIPGKSWISEPVSSSSSMTPGGSNPAAMFQILTKEGDTVTALGPSTIDGEAVHGFHVSINAATIERELAHSNLPSSVIQQTESMFGGAGIQMSVFVGDDTHLVRQITFSMHLSIHSMSMSAQATEDISNYGTPVSISAPPPDQVVSLQQFLQAGQAQSGVAT
jgi:hypothetical protein